MLSLGEIGLQRFQSSFGLDSDICGQFVLRNRIQRSRWILHVSDTGTGRDSYNSECTLWLKDELFDEWQLLFFEHPEHHPSSELIPYES